MTHFTQLIKKWYHHYGRKLPWRETRDPYKIWVSEIILQQTRIGQGTKYYNNFLNAFPDIFALAKASETDVMQQWQGLGYYSRARNMHYAAKTIVNDHDGMFPQTYKKIQTLKGIGPYTSSAIASFAFNLPYAVVDGNVSRILSRCFAIDTPIDSSQGRKQFQTLAEQLLDRDDPATHNQAIMDIGAIICKPANPLCDKCPLADLCQARKNENQRDYPVKSQRKTRKKRFLNFLIIHYNGRILIEKRTGEDIWKGLYQFPLMETFEKASKESMESKIRKMTGEDVKITKIHEKKHILTHQELQAIFFKLKWPEELPPPEISDHNKAVLYSAGEIYKIPFPQLIQEHLEALIIADH
ncbi:MAG: A/G-specific adenine glycosylase [Marinilabiliaceae bacterium]